MSPALPHVAIFGAGGYTGLALSGLLCRHPGVRLAVLASERLSGEGRGALDPALPEDLALCAESDGVRLCQERDVAVALLATPAEQSLGLAPALLHGGVRVLDLSGAFRLRDPQLFSRHYGLPAPDPALLEERCYALPEVTGTAGLVSARLVSNPGCYVTAAVLALAPLLRHRLLPPDATLFIDGKSGASGAGRKAAIELSLCELEADLRPYRIGRHQHTPEIAAVLTEVAGRQVALSFVPHLCATRRGLLVTCHGRLDPSVTSAQAQAAYVQEYAGKPRIHLVPPEQVTLRRPVGTPDAWVGLWADDGGIFCALSSLDNLLKGAASQAVQNLNAMLSLPEGAGLDHLWSPAA